MLYTTVKFLVFLIAVFILYFIVPRRFRWIVLFAGSLFFYAGVGVRAFCFLFFSAVSTYAAGLGVEAMQRKAAEAKKAKEKAAEKRYIRLRKLIFGLGLLANLGILCYMKYFNFLIENLNSIFALFSFRLSAATRNILMPLGLSFYTFQVVGYLLDVSRGEQKAERNFPKYMLFVSFFPQIIQGPIGRYNHLAPQLFEGHSFDKARVYDALLLIMWGFFKKMVIADRAAIFANTVFGNYQQYAGFETFIGLFIYGIQLYADFSGGIDISRGAAQVVGIDMAQNFNHPFFSKSVAEYWNRWHMSLGAWMQDYVFYAMPKDFRDETWAVRVTVRLKGSKTPKEECQRHLLHFPREVEQAE